MRVAIFASGNGTNFEVLTKQFQNHQLAGNVVLLFCDHPDAYVMKRAQHLNVPAFSWTVKEAGGKEAYEKRLLKLLQTQKIDLILLAGYLRVVGATILDQYERRIINLHPAWLPEYPGLHSIERAYRDQASETGVTVHFIDRGLDTGPIIMQERVPIHSDDSLAELENRVHEVEHRLYPQAVKQVLSQLTTKE
ncbi:phosphoribosylglycinamide formyltransferase [Limosilactobacillus coleohominis]|uniref:phosphoribosylglycinamide formyltransferase n=1 Tax=Limosilactobacillus coleohominis TaxID=181675 RepID=UPI00030E2DE4|nr:phosphoribosylglycinamide formyltransferase [Limosilactobacillus coleohominis]